MMDHTLVFAPAWECSASRLRYFLAPAGPAVAAEDNPATVPVILLPAEGNPLVALRFVLRTGSQDDPPGKEGLAALTAAMVTEGGTANYPYDELLARFYPMAASLNGACHKEITAFSGTVHHDNLKHFLPLALEMLTKPRFAPEDFDRLKNEAIDYVSKTLRGGNDEELGKWGLQVALYKNHPYGHVDQGTIDGLKAITLDDVKAFHRARYTRDALTVGIAGAVDASSREVLASQLALLPSLPLKVPALPQLELPQGLEIVVIQKAAAATAISLGFPVDFTRHDDDFYALVVANSYLGEHRTFNGKLMQDLRGKRGLNYGDYSYIEDFIQDGMSNLPVPNNPRRQQYFSIWLRPVPNDKAVFASGAHLGTRPPRQARHEQGRLRGDPRLSPQHEQALDANPDATFGLRPRRHVLRPRRHRQGTGQAPAEADRRRRQLRRPAPSLQTRHARGSGRAQRHRPRQDPHLSRTDADQVRYQGTPAEILKEDEAIAAFPLGSVTVDIVPVDKMFKNEHS